MKKTGLIICFLIFVLPTANSQVIRSFTPDSLVFIQELKSYFERISAKEKQEQAQLTLESFEQSWLAGIFDASEKQEIYQLANLMLDKKISPWPEFETFLRTLLTLKTADRSEQQYTAWLKAVRHSLESKRRTTDFNTLIEFTDSFLSNRLLYQSRIFLWQADYASFRFVMDTVFRVSFDKLNLICKTDDDSTIIYNTSGFYFPSEYRWEGQGGKLTWERVRFDPDKVFASLDQYSLSLKSADFTIDQVNFYNKNYFAEPLLGSLREKVVSGRVDSAGAKYPEFRSERKDLFIDDLFKDIDYQGGFAQKGAAILGEGSDQKAAQLSFKRPYRDKQGRYDLLVARAGTFIIKPDRIVTDQAQVSIYHQDDSIFHTGLQFKYMDKKREVALLRTDQGLMENLYMDSFHKVDIDCEAVYWPMDSTEIRFRSIEGIQPLSKALFMSDKFFIEQQYNSLQGIDYTHPLIVVYNYIRENNTDRFFVYQLARFMKLPEEPVELLMIRLAKYGFIFYNPDTRQAIVREKLFHYVDAKGGRTDYDVISFYSRVENKDNARLSLDNFDLSIQGVPQVFISDSQSVYITPADDKVILRKNRDFLFSGKIEVGLFEFNATNCTFEYDTFRLNLPTIDKMRFKVRAFDDKEGEVNYVDVKTVISDISGEILIDYPTNKNGLREYPEYPIFSSKSESSVFYNHDSIHRNAYDSSVFNYHIDPFTIKNLANFSTDNLQFGGQLNSAGIFPPEVNKPLTVMPDYSLGFQIISPAGGYPIYRGKGTFRDTVSLSNAGFRARGSLDYLNTKSTGTNLMLYPDSAKGRLATFAISKKQTAHGGMPSVSGTNLDQKWLPYQDSMTVASRDSAMLVFDGKASLAGSLTFTPEVLTGGGKMKFYNAETNSNNYTFATTGFTSDSLSLKIKNLNEESLAFVSDKFSANVDLAENTGNFKSLSDSAGIEFPLSRYHAAMDEFDWYIDRNEIVLKNYDDNGNSPGENVALEALIDIRPAGGRFTSLHPLQDSLFFYAPEATFNIADTSLSARGVAVIKVADAAIFPGDGKVTIEPNAEIAPLLDATIIADTANKNHRITNAVVSIESRYSYKASGFYAYQNQVGDIQTIEFDDIRVDTSYQTIAEGTIAPEQSFMFSPRFAYQGKVRLEAGLPQLQFDGAFKIVQDCDTALSRWVSFSGPIDNDSLAFPVPGELEEFGEKDIYAGIFHSNEENRIYPAFLSRKAYYSDKLMMTVDGILKTRDKGQTFIIGAAADLAKGDGENPKWPSMSLHTEDCTIDASGVIDFGTDFGQVSMAAFGQAQHFIIPDSTVFRAFITLDFFFSDEALENMASDLAKASTEAVEIENPVSNIAYRLMLGEEVATEYVYELNTFGAVNEIPEALNKNLVISDVSLVYHPDSRSYISVGKIGIGILGGKTINKYFEGYLEIVRKRSGDIFQLYLEIDRRNWYFFNHSGNLMQSIAGKNEYNRILADIDAKKRKGEADKGEVAYRYIISTNQKKNRFLRAMRQQEFNENDEEE